MARANPTTAGGPTPQPAYAGVSGTEKGLAVATHLLGLLTAFVGPLVLYLVFKRSASPWLRNHLDESLNYWIMVTVAAVVLTVLTILLGSSALVIYVALLAVLVVLVAVVFGVVAIVKAAMGKAAHYPLNLRLIR